LENPSLIGASELSSRLHSGFSVLTTLLFALLAEGLADLDGERLRDAADFQRLGFGIQWTKLTAANFNFQDWAVSARIRPARRTRFPLRRKTLFHRL
jgi:hypothetical protein